MSLFCCFPPFMGVSHYSFFLQTLYTNHDPTARLFLSILFSNHKSSIQSNSSIISPVSIFKHSSTTFHLLLSLQVLSYAPSWTQNTIHYLKYNSFLQNFSRVVWPSGLRRWTQVPLYESMRGFKSHSYHLFHFLNHFSYFFLSSHPSRYSLHPNKTTSKQIFISSVFS